MAQGMETTAGTKLACQRRVHNSCNFVWVTWPSAKAALMPRPWRRMEIRPMPVSAPVIKSGGTVLAESGQVSTQEPSVRVGISLGRSSSMLLKLLPPKVRDAPAAATGHYRALWSEMELVNAEYTGDCRDFCGSTRMRQAGACKVCEDCGESGGCG